MPKPKIRLAGFVTTDAYMTVHFTVAWQNSTRYLECKVPMSEIAKDVQFGLAYDKAAARLLKDHWEADSLLPPWEADDGEHQGHWSECVLPDTHSGSCSSRRHG